MHKLSVNLPPLIASTEVISCACWVGKADADLEREKNFYRVFSIVKYSYLPTDTLRKYVERHVTWRKLAFQFTGYGRQTR